MYVDRPQLSQRTHRVRLLLPCVMLVAISGACSAQSGEPAATDVPEAATSTSDDQDAQAETDAGAESVQADVTVTPDVERLEERYEAVVGLYAIDTSDGTVVAHREEERFAHASTLKALAAAAVLQQADAADLDEVLNFSPDDLVSHSPVTEQHVTTGMTLREVIDAAVRESDNTAANLLFEQLGGPSGLETALRDIGDETTVVARWEPELNDYDPDDERDTTTAEALATTLGQYLLDGVLSEDAEGLLLESMRGTVTGNETIRAGVPEGWDVANKTGSGSHGGRNDVAILWPEEGSDPVIIAVLTRSRTPDGTSDDALLADTTGLALDALGLT